MPNLALEDVPIGKDERSNKLISKNGRIKSFSFKTKSHAEIGLKNNQIDFDTSIKLSGSRFVVLKDKFGLLERELMNFLLDIHSKEFEYVEVSPPLIVNEDVMFGTGQLPKFEEINLRLNLQMLKKENF